MTTLKDYGFCADSRSDQTVAEAAHQWIEWSQVRRGRQPTTLLAYRHVMKHFLPWVGDMDVAAVTRMEIESFVTRKHPTVHNIQPRPIPDEQWRQWWGHDLPDSLRVALGLGFYGGLRRAEMVSLVVGQVTDEAILRFVRKGGGEHTLPWADMRNALKKRLPHLVDEDDLMLPALRRLRSRGDDAPLLAWASLDPGEVNKRVRRWAERHDLPPFTPHQLRHSTATNLLRARVPLHLVTSLLNHSSPTITMRYVAAGASQLTEYLSNQED